MKKYRVFLPIRDFPDADTEEIETYSVLIGDGGITFCDTQGEIIAAFPPGTVIIRINE